MSRKYCGVLESIVLNTRVNFGSWFAAPTSPQVAASSCCRPRPLRSSTIILKPPPRPRPLTGGGSITKNCASCTWLSAALSCCTMAAEDWFGSRSPNGFSNTNIAAALLEVVNVAADRPAIATTLVIPLFFWAMRVDFSITSSVRFNDAPLGNSIEIIR